MSISRSGDPIFLISLYSYLNASIGLSLAAWRAGQRPKPMPTAREKVVASNIENGEIFVAQSAKIAIRAAMPEPKKIPTIPPVKVITTASIRN